MRPLPQAPPPDWRRYMIRAVIWVAFIGALGYAATYGELDFLGNDVNLRVEANRDSVALAGTTPAVIEVKVRLRNNTGKAAAFRAPSACKVFRWQIFDTGGGQVQARYDPNPCPDIEVTTRLEPGQQIEEFYSIPLVVERFKPGQEYLVRIRYWDREGEFTFATE